MGSLNNTERAGALMWGWLFSRLAVTILFLGSFIASAQVTAFHADFEGSAIEAGTDDVNLEAGTAVGGWSLQMAQNVNVYGNAAGTEKALCPDSNGNGGYGLTANFNAVLSLQSNGVVTLKLARGRSGTSGTGKAFNILGYDSLGNPSFDLQVFANQDQAAGTNGALYWNNGSSYTNWFGTNYSTAGDVRQIGISATGYNPPGMTALTIQLQGAGYIVSLDRDNNGAAEWVSSLLPYNSGATTISRISFTGGNGSGNWFDDILVTGFPGTTPANTISNAYVSIQPEDQAQFIEGWGFDIKGTSGNNVTPAYANTLFVTDKMHILRVPVWGNISKPAHPAAGVVVGSYYTDQLYAMTNARAANSNVILFASKKLEGDNSFPDWTKNSSGVIASQYAVMLADYLQYVYTNGGFTIDVLGIDNERAFNEGNITASVYNDVINQLRALSVSRGFPLPKQFIAPENYNPDTSWLSTLVGRD